MVRPTELVLVGRTFEGFDRALGVQLSATGQPARHELWELGELERSVLYGDATTSGDIDVLMILTDWLPALIAQRRLLPLDEHFAARAPEGWPDAWVPALRALQRGSDGHTYGVAYHDGPMLLLYRADLYDNPVEQRGFAARFGYPLVPPVDWTQFHDHAVWFTRPEQGLYGTVMAGYPDEHNNVYDFLTQLWSRGGDLVTESGGSGLQGEAAGRAVSYLHDLWHRSRVMDPAAAGWDSVAAGVHFAAGEAALMVNWCGFAALSADPQSPTRGVVECAPCPRGEGPAGSTVTMNAYWVLTVPRAARDPEESVELIRRLTTREMDVTTAMSGGSATRLDSWADPRVRALSPYYEVLETAHRHSRSVPADPRWPRVAAILNEMMQGVVAGAASGPALEQAHVAVSGVLAS